MSVARCREINARLRDAGIVVHEWPDWETNGNGQTSRYEGGLVHHTGSQFAMALPGTGIGRVLVNGRLDLSGPLCNYAGNVDSSLTLISAHPANHAGASGGKSMGPLPVTSVFNPRVMGLEIVYPGSEPMRPGQYHTALVWARITADVVGYGDIQRIRLHAETSITGKWDAGQAQGRPLDAAAFRASAAVVLAQPEEEFEPMSYAYPLPPSPHDANGELLPVESVIPLPWQGGAGGVTKVWAAIANANGPMKLLYAHWRILDGDKYRLQWFLPDGTVIPPLQPSRPANNQAPPGAYSLVLDHVSERGGSVIIETR